MKFGPGASSTTGQLLAKGPANHAARVRDFSPARLVGWLQHELRRYFMETNQAPFTLHDFRKTAITEMQMAGVSEKACSTLSGQAQNVVPVTKCATACLQAVPRTVRHRSFCGST